MDDRDFEQPDRAECPTCHGSGNVHVIIGDRDEIARCEDCGGLGYQLTRDEFANIEALQGDRDLRLVEEPEDMPSFRDHAEEIAWHMARRTA